MKHNSISLHYFLPFRLASWGHKLGSGLLLSHLMFMLSLIFLRNMIIKDLNIPIEFSSDFCAIFILSVRFHQRPDHAHHLKQGSGLSLSHMMFMLCLIF